MSNAKGVTFVPEGTSRLQRAVERTGHVSPHRVALMVQTSSGIHTRRELQKITYR